MPFQGKELSAWLDREVCRVVDGLAERPDFRLLACWPLRELIRGASGQERRLVETVDVALVEIAQQQVGYSTQAPVREKLLRLGPHNERLPDEALAESRNETAIPRGLPEIEQIANRPWHDLVAEADYFHPVCNLNLKDREAYLGPDSQHTQIGVFLPIFNPQLRRLGDHVSRSLLIRIDYWKAILQRYSVRCNTALRMAGENPQQLQEKEVLAWSRLREGYDQLNDICFAGSEAARREACIALLQVYAAYRPRADLSWLGPIAELSQNSAAIRDAVERRADFAKPEQVAAALREIADLYRRNVDDESRIEAACQNCQLVIVAGPGRRELYWQNELVDADWVKNDTLWEFVLVLVDRARRALGADAFDVEKLRGFSLKDARHRLKRLIPETMDLHIKASGTGTYRLDLPLERIALMRVEQDDRLVSV
jgi:hypothetical protein